MKKMILILIMAVMAISANAQHAKVDNDTAKYENRTYALSDTITLGYGSKPDKSFGFISIGSAFTGVTDLDKGWSKFEAVIDKVYTKGKKVYLRAKLVDKTVNALGGNKLFIDLEGAIDNKELK
ncbi:MAG: hypothetical protein H7178_10970 [Chitinophagaceae bacterium]|nr:hypothetical protein [Chitinophagaceae bacterium]